MSQAANVVFLLHEKLKGDYGKKDFTPEERILAEEIFQMLNKKAAMSDVTYEILGINDRNGYGTDSDTDEEHTTAAHDPHSPYLLLVPS
ncbi:hypothetical protein DdX_12871 [Ditylenchus destructor]|uniref:Uncharacterized protein n=1 Tax=Ditylenchus destructor TaxID=166010 RepID=A0AAD4R002_9BILA|nr:hypothetical protein DdX_12871 [Ditylenchus destructor]